MAALTEAIPQLTEKGVHAFVFFPTFDENKTFINIMKTKELTIEPIKSVVEKFQENRSPKIWGEIYRRYYQRVYRFCLKMGLGREDALDMGQDILLKVYSQIQALHNPGSFESWLFRTAHNACINHLKDKSKHRMEPIESMPFEKSVEPAEVVVKREEAVQEEYGRMTAILADLPSDTRRLLKLKYLDNCPVNKLKEMFDLNESAVKMRLLRAKKKVRLAYQQQMAMTG